MKIAILVGIIAGLVAASFVYDIAASLMHSNTPHFYVMPILVCDSFWGERWTGIALPPFGIWICSKDFNNAAVRRHELVHWAQYKRSGTLGFYASYVYGWAGSGFSYEKNPMEIEANK